MSSTPRPIRRLMEYTARSGVSISELRAAFPITGWLLQSRATTEGSRFKPSSPGITTGISPCMNATREFVVPRSMPTMYSDLMRSFQLRRVPPATRRLRLEPADANAGPLRRRECSLAGMIRRTYTDGSKESHSLHRGVDEGLAE